MKQGFEVLSHTADLKIRVYGKNLQMLFCNTVKGMFESIGPLGKGEVVVERSFDIFSHDLPSLLVDFLSEALYLSDVNGEAYFDVSIDEITNTRVRGVFRGVSINNFEMGEIKAVTHHGLRIEERDGAWVAEILFDL
ncbi:archease [Candidatus Dependentiae bacterium]|nr:archease [Candidatus Dependentiae bacterium]